MSRSLLDLYPQTRAKAQRWLALCASNALPVLVTSTVRTFAEQDALYAEGRTVPPLGEEHTVTNARGGQSYHNVARALDFVPLLAGGKPDWREASPSRLKIAALGEQVGLRWGGHWPHRPDGYHLEDEFCAACAREVGPGADGAEHFDENGECRLRGNTGG